MNNTAPISVIIPALNEAEQIRATLLSLQTDPETEIIVVDGGSRDATASVAAAAGVTVLSAPRGRARQQNLGAAAASGEILFFLHADTQAPRDYAQHIRQALQSPGVGAGAFSLAIAGSRPGLKAITQIANLRSRWLQLPYGDQGLFLPASLFFRLGGFPEQPIMEDFALVRKVRRSRPHHHASPNRAHLRPPLAAPGPLADHIHQPTDDFRLLSRGGPGHPGSNLSQQFHD